MKLTVLPTVKGEPLHNLHLMFFCDGLSYYEKGRRVAGCAVTTQYMVLKAGSLANVYADSKHALGVVFAMGIIWRERGFLTAAGL